MEDELLSEQELDEALAEANEIEKKPAKKYKYMDPDYKGGPRKKSQDELEAAAIELAAARLVVKDFEQSLLDAQILLYSIAQRLRAEGVPVEFIAEHSGLRYRSRVYKAVDKDLPKLLEKQNENN